MNPIINFWLKQLSRLFLVFPKKKKNVKKHEKNVILFIVDISFHIVEPLQIRFLEKLSMTNSWVQQFFRLSLAIPIHDLICFTQIFANNVKPSQTWCFTILEKSYLTYHRVKTIFKKAPCYRLLAWLGVNPDLSNLQHKRVSKKSVYWLHDVVNWKSALILHIMTVHQCTQRKWTWKMLRVDDTMDI